MEMVWYRLTQIHLENGHYNGDSDVVVTWTSETLGEQCEQFAQRHNQALQWPGVEATTKPINALQLTLETSLSSQSLALVLYGMV